MTQPTLRQKQSRIRNWKIFQLRSTAAMFNRLGNEVGIAVVNDELMKLGVPEERTEKPKNNLEVVYISLQDGDLFTQDEFDSMPSDQQDWLDKFYRLDEI